MKYDYECRACGTTFEATQSIHDAPLTQCEECGADSLRRILYAPTIMDRTPQTLGTQAERNGGPGRRYWLEKQQHDAERDRAAGLEQLAEALPAGMSAARQLKKPEKPWWRPTDRIDTTLTELTPKQKANFILTGDSSHDGL